MFKNSPLAYKLLYLIIYLFLYFFKISFKSSIFPTVPDGGLPRRVLRLEVDRHMDGDPVCWHVDQRHRLLTHRRSFHTAANFQHHRHQVKYVQWPTIRLKHSLLSWFLKILFVYIIILTICIKCPISFFNNILENVQIHGIGEKCPISWIFKIHTKVFNNRYLMLILCGLAILMSSYKLMSP